MKYTARDESRMANIARGEAEYSNYVYLSQDSYQELYTFIQSGSALSVLLYFTLI